MKKIWLVCLATAMLVFSFCGCSPKDEEVEKVKSYRKAAEQGNAKAQYNLGVCYENGYGVEKNYFKAVKWYRKAAEQGLADAQNNLGVCYYFGYGVEKNYSEAVKWWRRAAEQGNAKAQEVLRRLGK